MKLNRRALRWRAAALSVRVVLGVQQRCAALRDRIALSSAGCVALRRCVCDSAAAEGTWVGGARGLLMCRLRASKS